MPHTPGKNTELVKRIVSRDRAAEAELVERYSGGLRLLLLKKTGGDRDLASDLCQDTFIIAIRKIRDNALRNPEALPAFLRQTASNLVLLHYRKHKRYVFGSDKRVENQLATESSPAEQQVESDQIRSMILEAIDQLAIDRDRELLVSFYLDDVDKATICGRLDLSAAHFDRVLYRARKRMRQILRENSALRHWLIGGP